VLQPALIPIPVLFLPYFVAISWQRTFDGLSSDSSSAPTTSMVGRLSDRAPIEPRGSAHVIQELSGVAIAESFVCCTATEEKLYCIASLTAIRNELPRELTYRPSTPLILSRLDYIMPGLGKCSSQPSKLTLTMTACLAFKARHS